MKKNHAPYLSVFARIVNEGVRLACMYLSNYYNELESWALTPITKALFDNKIVFYLRKIDEQF
jgi:hypothetical protein